MVMVVLCSVALLPMTVHANSWNDHITLAIANYDKEKGVFSVTIEMNHDSKVSNNSFRFEYTAEDSDGNKTIMTSNQFVYMGGTTLEESPQAVDGSHIVSTIPVLESDPIVKLYVNIEGYVGELEIDVNNFQMPEGATYPISYPDTSSIKETNNTPEDIYVELNDESTKLSDSLLEMAIDGKVGLYVGKAMEDGENALYVWSFDGRQMTRSDYDLDLGITIGSSKNDKLINSLIPTSKDTPLPIEFAHHGELPEGTIVILNVSSKYKDGEKLTMYYFNEETKKLEEVANEIEVIDGYVALQMEHCSEYVLAKENSAPNNAQTSSMNVVFYAGVALCSFVGVIALLASQRKNAKK